ncbi:hypothetical protein PTRA_a0175 [Pseudoalteromonas translucida KMM 520]|uniref:Uncharacterized protein n=1 Tax=Pseudoalteromonas translucida KMM 520 TaxID=1315283 RepID=A0A0U2W8Z5_9GAMM|nr:hypothetical protein PTRA_a0175 [Pseudoalteromonas translucida KMM 520]
MCKHLITLLFVIVSEVIKDQKSQLYKLARFINKNQKKTII